MYKMDETESKPTKRRDYTKKVKKNPKGGPKAPRYDRKEEKDPMDQYWDEVCDTVEELIDLEGEIGLRND